MYLALVYYLFHCHFLYQVKHSEVALIKILDIFIELPTYAKCIKILTITECWKIWNNDPKKISIILNIWTIHTAMFWMVSAIVIRYQTQSRFLLIKNKGSLVWKHIGFFLSHKIWILFGFKKKVGFGNIFGCPSYSTLTHPPLAYKLCIWIHWSSDFVGITNLY